MAEIRLSASLFPRLDSALGEIRLQRERLEAIALATAELRREIAGARGLGARIPVNQSPRVRPAAIGAEIAGS
jgi:hypothetical protein